MAASRVNGILLDSSVVVAYLRGRTDIFAFIQPGEKLGLPLVALGELYKGAEKSAHVELNRGRVDALLSRVDLLRPSLTTAKIYASTAATLEARGLPIADNDLWIAATALEFEMPLATRDAHFNRVPGLSVLAW